MHNNCLRGSPNCLLPAPAARQHSCQGTRPVRVNKHRHLRIAAQGAATLEPASVASPDVRVLRKQGAAYTVGGSITSGLTAEQVFDVLADYPNLHHVFSNIKGSQVSNKGSSKELLQVCEWRFLVFSGTFNTHLTVKEDRNSGRLVFNLISSPFMKDFTGSWHLTPRQGGGCNIKHELTVTPVLSAPAMFDSYTQRIFVQQVTKILEDLDNELQSRR